MSRWANLLAAYEVALAAERDFDAKHIAKVVDRYQKMDDGPDRMALWATISDATWAESQRLQDARCDLEDPLMACPSPDARAFARKFLIAHGEGRETDVWDEMLEAEAQRFATEASPKSQPSDQIEGIEP